MSNGYSPERVSEHFGDFRKITVDAVDPGSSAMNVLLVMIMMEATIVSV